MFLHLSFGAEKGLCKLLIAPIIFLVIVLLHPTQTATSNLEITKTLEHLNF